MVDQLTDEVRYWQALVKALQADRDNLLRQRDEALRTIEALRDLGGNMPCEPQIFKGLTRSGFTALCARVRQQLGISINADSGTASQSGFTVEWHYDPADQTLTLQVREKPFFLSSAIVNDQVRKLVSG